MRKNYLEEVWNDVKSFLNIERQEIFYNERELQVALALFLENTKKYRKIYLEYYVPTRDANNKPLLNYEPWNNEIKMDIVVDCNGCFIPIELKYKTKRIKNCDVTRFGEIIENVDIIKDQSAQDLGRYDFWKDVRRIEIVKKHFKKVVGVLLYS